MEILEDREIARFEEDLEGEAAAEKNEVPLEPFNMKRENKARFERRIHAVFTFI